MSFFSSSKPDSNLATAKAVLSTAASVAATAMVIRSVASEILPPEFMSYVRDGLRSALSRFSSETTMVIEEFDGLVSNQIYEAAETYLGSKISPFTQRLKVTKPETEDTFILTMERNECLNDVFNGVKFNWVLVCRQVERQLFHNPRDMNSTLKSEVRSLELSFHKKHKDMVLNTYLPFILREAKSLKQETKALRIFTVDYHCMYGNPNDAWTGINLDHPATFDTLAMERDVKEFVVRDLETFVARKEHYRKVGKAWKRGYLLYGPPGTGKSSLIAAMANYLRFDVYDLELTQLQTNSDLRRLLIAMANRSILVVEDIDCTIEFHERRAELTPFRSANNNDRQVTLSGLLNFVDGLWSSCGDERIIVFTTNHKEKLDPALLRPGRMDVHIHMSYCTPCGFRQLSSNYLGLKEHDLFPQIEEEIQKTQVTPAEVAEQLLKSNDTETCLKQLIDFLREKKETQELEAKRKEQEAKDKEEQQKKELDDGDKGEGVDNDEKKSTTELNNTC
ncbi:AAA-ATPase At3g50940-like [Vigna umbellata]|uniref:AAA-ATPase At3g50940-like n=1 Tax=Vigna umbellata TaxID=87088 RepID=UPI001F5F3040|nr:AAA-ATPase At3g50940-like [Vigna umbellata]